MEQLDNLITMFFVKTNKCISSNELRKILKIKGEKQTDIFNSALRKLVEDGSLFFDGKNYKLFTENLGYAYGEIEINRLGNGIVHTKNGIIFIENSRTNGALNGDKVIVNNIKNSNKNNNYEGNIYKVLKRKFGKIIYKVIGDGVNAKLIPYNKTQNIDIYLNNTSLKSLKNGNFIVVDVSTEKRDNKYFAEIDKIIQSRNPKEQDVQLLFEEYNIPTEFSKEALEEAKNLPKEVRREELSGRIDLREKQIITIDCDNTKDMDDAVYVEKCINGNYKLFVSISDVSHYVKKGSKLYEEAKKRCNSHYINNTCNPMFPKELSNGICSLNENVDRLTKTIEVEIDKNGNIINYNIYKSIINSKRAMKYSKVNKLLKGDDVKEYHGFEDQLNLLNELSNILEQTKKNRNYIDFNIRDIEQIENEDGNIIGFKKSDYGPAHLMIENLMLIANETIARNYSWMPFIYRVHEKPDENAIKQVLSFLKVSEYKIPSFKNISAAVLNNVLISLNKDDDLDIAKSLILKQMKRAKYSTYNLGHYALQLDNYCHFTSPIRRIADFINHSLIDNIENMDYSEESIRLLEKELTAICDQASSLEKLSRELEQKGLYIEMAKYMEKYIGEEFEAYITEIYERGMLAKTKNMILGMINISDIPNDKYYYDYNKKALIGKETKKKFLIGDKIYVIVKECNKLTNTIYFKVSNNKTKKINKEVNKQMHKL